VETLAQAAGHGPLVLIHLAIAIVVQVIAHLRGNPVERIADLDDAGSTIVDSVSAGTEPTCGDAQFFVYLTVTIVVHSITVFHTRTFVRVADLSHATDAIQNGMVADPQPALG